MDAFANVDDLMDYLRLTVTRRAPGGTPQRYRLVHIDTLGSALGLLSQQQDKIEQLERSLTRALERTA